MPRLSRPLQRGPQVVMLAIDQVEQRRGGVVGDFGTGAFGQIQEVRGMREARAALSPRVASASWANSRIVSSMVKRGVSGQGGLSHDQTLVDQGSRGRSRVSANVSRSPPRPPPASSRRRRPTGAEEGLLLRCEQVVAPGDRVAHRLLARRQVAGAAGQQAEAIGSSGPARPPVRGRRCGRRPVRSPAAGHRDGDRARRRGGVGWLEAKGRAGSSRPGREEAHRCVGL